MTTVMTCLKSWKLLCLPTQGVSQAILHGQGHTLSSHRGPGKLSSWVFPLLRKGDRKGSRYREQLRGSRVWHIVTAQ